LNLALTTYIRACAIDCSTTPCVLEISALWVAMFYELFIPDRSYRENGGYTCCVRSVFFYLKTATLASLKANKAISREKGPGATYLRRL